MLKCGQTKIPIPYRTCNYCKHENGKLTDSTSGSTRYCTLRSEHKHINHWVSAQKNKSCCGWEPAEGGYNRLARDRLAGKAEKLDVTNGSTALASHPHRGQASKYNQQHFSWISFMKRRPCIDEVETSNDKDV